MTILIFYDFGLSYLGSELVILFLYTSTKHVYVPKPLNKKNVKWKMFLV